MALIVASDSCRIGTVGVKQEVEASIELKPTIAGSGALLVNFNSDELKNIKSFIDVVVKEWSGKDRKEANTLSVVYLKWITVLDDKTGLGVWI